MGKSRPFFATRSTTCLYCRRGPLLQGRADIPNSPLTATRDHFVPRHEGAEQGAGRWVPSCHCCNELKGALRPGAWFAFIDNNPGYWRSFPSHGSVVRWLIDHNRWRRSNGWRSIALFTEAPLQFMALANGVW